MHDQLAGMLIETPENHYIFQYQKNYVGSPISLTMPMRYEPYRFDSFPPFFDGLLPEGLQLEGLLKSQKLDRTDYFGQLLATGGDLVGAITVHEMID
jgi:serine/threonine-protein kinase HipA